MRNRMLVSAAVFSFLGVAFYAVRGRRAAGRAAWAEVTDPVD